jgi:hypothetical protein
MGPNYGQAQKGRVVKILSTAKLLFVNGQIKQMPGQWTRFPGRETHDGIGGAFEFWALRPES